MEKEFVPYELAMKLKHLGFDETCMAIYKNYLPRFKWVVNDNSDWTNSNTIKDECSAPTWHQAFRWFREKYNVHAEITWSPSYEYEPRKWSDAIYEITFVDVSYTKEWKAESPDMQRGNGKQLTYEEAEITCLTKLIEIIENKK